MKIIQPRVARNELPWETRAEQDINSERVASNSNSPPLEERVGERRPFPQ